MTTVLFDDIARPMYPWAISAMAPASPASARATVPVLEAIQAGGTSFVSAPSLLPTSDGRTAFDADLSFPVIAACASFCTSATAAAKAATATITPVKCNCFILVFLSVRYSFLDAKSYMAIRCCHSNLTFPMPPSGDSFVPPTSPSQHVIFGLGFAGVARIATGSGRCPYVATMVSVFP